MDVYLNNELVHLSQQGVIDLLDLGYISGSLEEYIQSGDIPIIQED